MSFCVAPAANSARMIKSSDTDGSPASIFATRDWLDPMRGAHALKKLQSKSQRG
jgi:hypothetical protein